MTVAAVEAAVAVKQQAKDNKAQKKADKAQAQDAPPAGGGDTAPSAQPPDGSGPGTGAKGGAKPAAKGGGGKPAAKGAAKGGAKGGGPKALAWAWSGSRKILTAQFLLCAVILILGTLTATDDAKHSSARAMVKGSALALLFFLLALLSSGGQGSARTATALGTLVTAAYALTSSDVHALVTWIGDFFAAKSDAKISTTTPSSDEQQVEDTSTPGFG